MQRNNYPTSSHQHQQTTSYHQSSTASSQHHIQTHDPLSINNPSNPMYNSQTQQMTGNEAPTYWAQEASMEQGYPCLPQEASSYPTNEFPASFGNDLFQPEEIFQLDQPIRPDFTLNSNELPSRSPPSLLDLGSGTIKYEIPDIHESAYWTQLLSEDSSSSQVSVPQVKKKNLLSIDIIFEKKIFFFS